MKVYTDITQGSDEWDAIRLGKVTASRFSDVLNKRTGRGKYMYKLAAERLTGIKEEGYKNEAMQNGNDTESEARIYYEGLNGVTVEQVGFVERDEFVGVSPDGFVGWEGLVEIKCPLGSTHAQYLKENRLPPNYVPQVQGQLWACEREWCDFLSYYPYMPDRPMFCIQVFRDEKYIKNLESEVDRFVNELQELIERIKENKNV